jgi:predicted P-loop ATPase
LGTWLSTYLGAEQNEYTEQVGTMFLIGMVARIFEPGCKFDYMLILEGGQALMKSSACAILAGRRYFSDQLPDITSKEASQHLRGKWLIEVAELNAYSRAAIDHFKAYLVRQVERYRPPWGRKEVHEPRQCAFIGTTNKSRYLRDETGNRRFWPVATGEINLDALGRDRDQLLAEAVALYRSGAHWWPDREFELQTIAPEQETRFEVDAWEPLIRKYLANEKRTTLQNIAVKVLGFTISNTQMQGEIKTPFNRFGPKEQQRVSNILTHLKWEPKRNNQERWWERGPNTEGDTG